jgi:glycosyltransferase involved in cell wall biosynthesis
MTDTADLSVVMSTYEQAQYLPQVLVTQSVVPAEIIVVNDATTDETPAITSLPR